MRRTGKRAALWIAFAVALSAAFGTWTFVRLQASRAAAADSAGNLARCRVLAEDIKASRGGPQQTSVVAPPSFHPATFLDGIAEQVQLPKECIVYVRSAGTRRVGESVYMEHSVEVPLKGVAISQIVQFLHALTAAKPELRAKELRLLVPTQAGDSTASNQLWDADLTLTYFTVSRKTPRPKA